MLPNIKVSGD